MNRILFLTATLLCAAPLPAQTDPRMEGIDSIWIAQTPGYNITAPVFHVMFRRDGRATWTGSTRARPIGVAEGQITPEQWAGLARAADRGRVASGAVPVGRRVGPDHRPRRVVLVFRGPEPPPEAEGRRGAVGRLVQAGDALAAGLGWGPDMQETSRIEILHGTRWTDVHTARYRVRRGGTTVGGYTETVEIDTAPGWSWRDTAAIRRDLEGCSAERCLPEAVLPTHGMLADLLRGDFRAGTWFVRVARDEPARYYAVGDTVTLELPGGGAAALPVRLHGLPHPATAYVSVAMPRRVLRIEIAAPEPIVAEVEGPR